MAFALKTFILLSAILLANCQTAIQTYCKFRHIYADDGGDVYSFSNLNTILQSPHFNVNKPTTIYAYGLNQSNTTTEVRLIVQAYLANGDYNFLLLSCEPNTYYFFTNIVEIGDNAANSIVSLYNANYKQFHIVGYSLGGQVAGEIGRRVRAKTSGQFAIDRITGLDPGKLFNSGVTYLNSGDATFVDVIHAETRTFGSPLSNGDVTFWPNGGVVQPTCSNYFISTFIDTCSHDRPQRLWIESVQSKNPNKFLSRLCSSYSTFLTGACNSAQVNYMGLYVNRAAKGNFYLKTNANSPYSLS